MPFHSWLATIHRLLPLLLLSVGCDKLFAKDTSAPQAEEGDAPAIAASAKSEPGSENEGSRGGRFGVPFAWESSPEEPLARARSFMAEVLKANQAFMGQGRDHFKPFIEAERPRATVLTCADSRVQSAAWDQNPENDGYTVRNLGNQLATSLGSVQYGVERLSTPVLLIIGHTGCDAVKAALEKNEGADGPIADEIERIELPPLRRSKDFDATWKTAVIANVNQQVAQAVAQFGRHVQSGDLTVVGAVYDIRDDLDDGHGRLHIVNVNSNVEAARLEAFQEAVKEVSAKAASAYTPYTRRTAAAPQALPFQREEPPPAGARASVSALNMLASGNFPGLRPGMAVPGTVDLHAAPGYRPWTPSGAGHAHGEPDEKGSGSEHGGSAARGKARAGNAKARSAPAAAPGAPPAVDGAAPAQQASAAEDGHDGAAEAADPRSAPLPAGGARASAPVPARPSATAGHAATGLGSSGPPTSFAPRAPGAPAPGAHPAAPRSGPPVSRPLTPLAGQGRAGPPRSGTAAPRSGPPVSRPLTTPYPAASAPAAGSSGASRQAAPAPRAPARAPVAAGAAAATARPPANPGRPPAGPSTPAPPARGAAAPAAPPAPPQAGQGRAPAPGKPAPAPRTGGATAPAKRPAPAQGKPPAANAPAPAPRTPPGPPAQGSQAAPAKPPAPPPAPKPPAKPRLPMPGPVTAGPSGPEAEDAPPNRQKEPPARAKPAPPPAKAAPPAASKPPAAPPPKAPR